LTDDKGAIRIDDNSRFGVLSGYYFRDDFVLANPVPSNGIGANVPDSPTLALAAPIICFE